MSLDLTLYDDAALEALAPKGVVRRARRDFEAGLGDVKERDAKHAVVEADTETVRIDARGPKEAHCTCPATGMCRHILLAVMTLNAGETETDAGGEEAPASTAIEELSGLSQADVQSFAGADWAMAVSLATSSAGSMIQHSGRNCTVEIEGSPASVTFLAGLGLKGAAFKGPKARARAIVTAAALIVRAKHGVALDLVTEDDAQTPIASISRDYLDDASRKLAQCVRMVLAGASPVAADTLFDLAISARAEAAPRLTSQLRALTKQAGHAANRMVQFEPEAFLAEAARTYALVEALKRDASDVALTGVVRRDYQPAPAMDLWMLGAVQWTTESGARGLTLHGFCPADRQWRTVVQARGPGQDPTFDTRVAYTMPLWSVGASNKLIGRIVHLPAPLLSSEGAIAPTLATAPTVGATIPRAAALIDNGAAIAVWAELRADIMARRGFGLHRRATPTANLIAPAKFGALSFDDFTQNYEFSAVDRFGDVVRLVLPGDQHLEARRLAEMGRPPLLLTETSGDLDRPALRPVAIIHDGAQGVEIINLTLDQWARTSRSALGALQEMLPRKASHAGVTQDPLADLARRVLAEATTVCAGEPAPNLAQIEQSCDAAGLALLSGAVRRMSARPESTTAMAAAYVASETLATLSWA